MDLPEASQVKLVNDELMVIEIPDRLPLERRALIYQMIEEMKLSFKVLILDGGARVAAPTHEQLKVVHDELRSIREDLQLLIKSLAGNDEEPEQDLEGNTIGRARESGRGAQVL